MDLLRDFGVEAEAAMIVLVFAAGVLTRTALAGADYAAARSADCDPISTTTLQDRGVEPPPLLVESVREIPRDPVTGKHRLVESRLAAPTHSHG